MEIIKQGNLSRLKKTKFFECTYCGCEFYADSSEYRAAGVQYNILYYSCHCPCCKMTVYTEE